MKILHRKFLKKFRLDLPWISHVLNEEKMANELNSSAMNLEVHARAGSLCLICRGSRMLCGKPKCPAITRLYSFMKVKSIINSEKIFGSSPPAIFIGRVGYPYVYAGPLIPPTLGDTAMFDAPEKWVGKSLEEIIDFRTTLIHGKFLVNVRKPSENQRFLDETLEIALSKNPVDTEALFKKKPSGKFLFDDGLQPMGPSAPLLRIEVSNVKTDHIIEKAHSDFDLKAEEAILNLYKSGVPVSRLQRAFSMGAFGIKMQRRLVPTRWSITAVDSIISRRLIDEEVKENPVINEYRIYNFNYLGNRFVILLMPTEWRYEWIEAWHPGTLWNPEEYGISMGSDWEGYYGRKTYASLGGCYYAVRLAVAEALSREHRQAGVVAMREIHPDFITPLGVWINRECVREAMKREYEKFDTLKEALTYIRLKFSIGIEEWIKISALLKDALYQERITRYLKKI